MKSLKDFSPGEWLRLLPLRHTAKQVRNNAVQAFYRSRPAPGLKEFLQRTRPLAQRNVMLVVAFQQPWAMDWLLRMARRHVADAVPLVFDNSRLESRRKEIAAVCARHGAPYLALPSHQTRHPNRSHGMAMTWIFHNVVRAIRPRIFAFIDHDMIPVRPVSLAERLGKQPFFGLLGGEDGGRAWHIWAGYCLFDFEKVAHLPLNFMYDFSLGLDTGGRLWSDLYRNHDRSRLNFASMAEIRVTVPSTGESRAMEVVDERWLHIRGIGYNGNFISKARFCADLSEAFDSGTSWADLCDSPQPRPA